MRAVVRARECGLPVRCRGGDRVARGGASSEILAESLRCHARTLTLLGTIDTGLDRVASFVRVDESFNGDTDNPPVHKGSEQFLMVGTNGNGTMGAGWVRDRARIVTVRRGRGVGRRRHSLLRRALSPLHHPEVCALESVQVAAPVVVPTLM